MKVAWLTPYLPDPAGGGGVAHEFELLRAAVRHHDVHVLCADLPPGETTLELDTGVATLEGIAPWSWRVAGPRNKLGVAWRLPIAYPSIDLHALRYRVRALADALSLLQERERFDLVHVTMEEIAPVVGVARAPASLLLFDVHSRQAQREREQADSAARRLRWSLEQRKLERWERRWLARYDAVACVSSVDADWVGSRIGRRPTVIPNPIPDAFFEGPSAPRSRAVVTFAGNLEYRPNVDAVTWLADEIWPKVTSRRPDARLRIVGRKPVLAVRAAVTRANGELHADVPDIRRFYGETAVAVAPVRLGSGQRNKVLHALACDAPVVATRTALEGISATSDDVLIADDASTFADAVVATLDDPDAAARRAAHARRLVAGLRADHIAEQFDQWWQDARRSGAGRVAANAAVTDAKAAVTRPGPMSATVVVCTRDRPALLRSCLASVAVAVGGREGVEVVVVEQGEPHAEAVGREVGLDVRVVHDDGVGASRARNVGVAAAPGDVVLFTDDDCEVPASWVDDHLAALTDDVTASFGPVRGLSRFGEADDPTSRAARHHRGTAPWWVGHSSNMAVRREALSAIGGFDERLGPGAPHELIGEDSDVIHRLLESGATVASGTGEPVTHSAWRDATDHRRTLRAYERGAGAWIGKAVRSDRISGWRALRDRLGLLDVRLREQPGLPADPVGMTLAVGAFVHGLARGLLMGSRDQTARRMRSYWDERAIENAVWFVDTSTDFERPDMDRFFATGRQIVEEALDAGWAQPRGRQLAVEIGSGLGRVCVALADRFDHVIGIDISPEMVDRATRLVSDPRVCFRVGDGVSLRGIDDASVDVVLSFTVFQHIPDGAVIEGYLREAGRVLRPGGVVVFQWNTMQHPASWAARRWLLSWLQRSGIRREPHHRNAAEFLGSCVPVSRVTRVLEQGGLALEAVKGEGSLFTWAWAVKR